MLSSALPTPSIATGEDQLLDVGRQRVGETRARTRSQPAPAALEHRVAGVLDEIDVVAEPAGHHVGAEIAVEHIVAVPAGEVVVAAAAVEAIGARAAELVVVVVAVDQVVAVFAR